MRAKVIVPFNDLEHPENTYYVGDEFEGTDRRVNELARKGFVEKPKTPPRKRAGKPKE